MCDATVIAAAAFAVSAAGSAATYAGQRKQAKAQENYQEEVHEQTSQAARENYFRQLNQSQLRLEQERASASQKVQEQDARGAEARARARVSSAESGAAGLSVESLIKDYFRQEATYRHSIGENFDMTRQQMGEDVKGLQAGNQNRINASRGAPVPTPSFLATGAEIGGSALDAYNQYLREPTTNG